MKCASTDAVLRVIGLSFRTAPAAVRDVVSFDDAAAHAFRLELAEAGLPHSLVLSTCNRCEIMFVGDEPAAELVRHHFRTRFPAVDLLPHLICRAARDAEIYLARLASGLESMVFGEYQILGQLKAAHAAALASGHCGGELDRAVRAAITLAKRVRTALDLGAVSPSVCRAGVDQVERSVGFAGRRVFVIGSGRTGTLAAKLAKRYGAASIAVCNRSAERAARLVAEIGATAVDYADRYAAIAASDIVISATASPHVVVERVKLQLTQPTVFLDLAVPRDVDPSLAKDPLATLVSIDTIGALAEGDLRERAQLSAKAMAIIDCP